MKKMKMILVFALMASTLSVLADDSSTTPLVSGGLKLQANASNFLMKEVPSKPSIHSTMNAGGEFGGFVDFNIKPHFLIQLNVMCVAAHCDLREADQKSSFWSMGLDVPLYFLGRYGSESRGYISFGGGPYGNFNVWGQLNRNATITNPYLANFEDSNGEQKKALSDFHSGLGAFIGYELPCGLQFNASYQIAVSDMFAFEHNKSSYLLPQKVSLGLAYRFHRK